MHNSDPLSAVGPAGFMVHTWRATLRRLADLSVGKKLLLIYLLDLSTVIFISGILIHEKYIAIDFSRKELAGTAYIEALRPTLIASGRNSGRAPFDSASRTAVAEAETLHGAGMNSANLGGELRDRMAALEAGAWKSRTQEIQHRQATLEAGRALVTRVGNQSNLILDPDLDSYYTMSLILLRYPALLGTVAQIAEVANEQEAVDGSQHTRLFVLEGELRAVSAAIVSDYSEAVAASSPILRERLAVTQARLTAAIERLRTVVRGVGSGEAIAASAVEAAERGVVDALDASWRIGNSELTRLIEVRVHDFFVRMWIHLGTAASLLSVILVAVFYVASRISQPLKALSRTVDTVRQSGDHSIRSAWKSGDEIGRLVDGFNDMLAQLDEQRKAQQELAATARAAEAQQLLLEVMPVPLMVTSIPDHRILHANPQARRWLGQTDADPWAGGMPGDQRRRFFQQLSDTGVVREFEARWQHGQEGNWAVLSARRMDYQGQDAVVTAFTPINNLKALEQRLELWAKVFEASSEGILLLDARGTILSANRAICKARAVDPADVLDRELDFVRVDDVPAPLASAIWATAETRGWWRGEVTVVRRSGGSFPAWAVLTAVRDAGGEIAHHIFSCLDITDRKAAEERVRYLAQHDELTGLPNRRVAEQHLREALQRSSNGGEPTAVLFIDLDRFKNINDSLGHQAGDALLKMVAQRLQFSIRQGDTVSRFGGDEFVVLLNGVDGSGEALQIAQRLVATLRAPYMLPDHELTVSCSVGIAISGRETQDMDELMRHADAAMYEAKASGRDGVNFFTPELNGKAQQRLRIEVLLRNAVARGELSLVYQPQVNSTDGTLVAVEALLRWHSPELGDTSPAVFIPVAEDSRLIVPIGEWVIDQACEQMASWRSRGLEVPLVSVNLSAVQLLDPQLLVALRASLERHGVTPGLLEFELTETTLMDSTEQRLSQLHALKALGLQLSIDDFGTGYSSLSYLSRLPMDKLKIDRSLVKNILVEQKDRAITEAIIALAHRLKMTVVAEGVESAAVQAALGEAWCDAIQGFHTGRPMRPADFEAWLHNRHCPTLPREHLAMDITRPRAP